MGSLRRLPSIDHKQIAPHMKFFADTRAKRHTALAVLLVWLFALASGVANACFLETHEPRGRAVKELTQPPSHAPVGLLAPLDVGAGHHDDSDSAKESCLKVCDDGTHTLPKAGSGVDHNDPGPAPWISTLWTGSSQVVSAPRRADDSAIPIVGTPLRVRYSRLAL
jgi:hypothetical protein